jgi:hypothetical protein
LEEQCFEAESFFHNIYLSFKKMFEDVWKNIGRNIGKDIRRNFEKY